MRDLTRQLQKLSDASLLQQTLTCAKREQQTTLELLHHLHEVQRRRLFAKPGYQSLWEYAVKALGYSEGAASERVGAMRLVFGLPEAMEMLKSGELTLSAAAKVQRHLSRCDDSYTPQEKADLLEQVSGQSVRETERILLGELGDRGLPPPERCKPITQSLTEIKVYANDRVLQQVERIRELEGNIEIIEMMELAFEEYLRAHDPLRKPMRKSVSGRAALLESDSTSATRTSKSDESSEEVAHEEVSLARRFNAKAEAKTLERSQGRCEYVDPDTDRRCESRYRIQTDHVIPFGKGGGSSRGNARHLCPAHNQFEAVRAYGLNQMSRYFAKAPAAMQRALPGD